MSGVDGLEILAVGPVPPELGSRNLGGVARAAWSQARALRRRGHRVRFVALGRYRGGRRTVDGVKVRGPRPSLAAFFACLGPWLRRQPALGPGWRVRDRLYLLYTMYRLATVDGPDRVDVIHAHAPYSACPVAVRLLGWSTPCVVTVHSYSAVEGGSRAGGARRTTGFYSDVLAHADALIHPSRVERDRGRDLGVTWACPDHVVHNAVAASVLPEPAHRDGVCFVGSLAPAKGLPELLDVWEEGAPDGQALVVVGSGELDDEVEAAASRTGQVQYLGYLRPDDVRRVVRRSLCLAVPSRRESLGLVYLESLVEGTPVVGYHRTLREIRETLGCNDREAAYIQPVNMGTSGPADLRAAIGRAVAARMADRDGEVAADLAARVEMAFGPERLASELEAVLDGARLTARRGGHKDGARA